jgi:peroxiredoxin
MPKVALNTQAPDFHLVDFKGQSRSLSEFKGKKNVILVFNRGFV